MHEINESYLQVGWIVGRVGYPRYSATFIMKGTYRLRPGEPAIAADLQDPLSGDVHEGDDPDRPLRYCSDFAYFKPKTDILLVGRCHAPGGTPANSVPVSLSVGSYSKTLRVTGDRFWKKGFLGYSATEPQAFTEIDLSYANSFGGPGCALNPCGKGHGEFMLPGGSGIPFLPNIEDPDAPVRRRGDRTNPAGFGPLALTWAQRRAKAGSYGERWLKDRWPWLPEDLDWGFYNAAPEDQQIAYLKGDESLRLENLHPKHRVYQSSLPGIRVRCFYAEVIGAPVRFVEVPLALDTLWIDSGEEKLVLVWRGLVELNSENLREEDQVLVSTEPLQSDPLPPFHYERLFYRHWQALLSPTQTGDAEDALGPEAETDAPEASETEAFDRQAAADLADADEPAPPTARQCLDQLARGESLQGVDLSGIDFTGAELEGVALCNAILADAFLRGARLAGADLSGAVLSGADLTGADLRGAILTGSDCTGAKLVRSDLRDANLEGCDFTDASLRSAQLQCAQGESALFVNANLLGASLRGAHLAGADLSRACLHEADLTACVLADASLEDARGFPVVADRANLTAVRASGAEFWESSFREVYAPGSIWQGAQLRQTDFSGAYLSAAEFEGAGLEDADLTCSVLRRARLVGATLRGAVMRSCDLLSASLEKADVAGADLSGSNLYGTEILETDLEGASLDGCNLKLTTLVL